MKWPFQIAKVKLVAKHTTKIRKAFRLAINGDEIVRQWMETHPAGGSISPELARNWAQVHAITKKQPIQNALASMYADSYVLGERIAKANLSGLKKDATPVSVSIVDWSTWKPGNPSAAALVKPRGGLESLMATRKVFIADDLIVTKLNRIGTALATSLEKGFNAKQTAEMIDYVIDDPAAAMVIARTEVSRAVSTASRNSYEAANVQQVEWLVADGCDICQENAEASPIGIDETFPSGDSEPPAHPNCECALSPYFEDLPEDMSDEEI